MIKGFSLNYYKSKNQVIEAVFNKIVSIITKQGDFHLAVSGGNSPLPLFSLLNDWFVRNAVYKKGMKVCWVDERIVSYSSQRSNYGRAIEVWPELNKGIVNCPFPVDKPIEEISRAYEQSLRKLGFIVDGSLKIDAAVLGMGEDGHTASLFPTIKLQHRNQFVAVCYINELQEWRGTFTYSGLNSIKKKYALILGPIQKRILRNCISANSNLPFSKIIDNNTTIFTDIDLYS